MNVTTSLKSVGRYRKQVGWGENRIGFLKGTKRKLFYPALVLLVFCIWVIFESFIAPVATKAAWFDDNWAYRQAIPITSTNGSDQSNVYVSFTLNTSSSSPGLIYQGKLQSACQDIRVTDASGNVLKYFIPSSPGCNNSATAIHALLPTLINGNSTIYVYYGNPSAYSMAQAADFSTLASNYSIGSFGSEENAPIPQAWWKFDDGQSITAKDSSSNANTATLGGSTLPLWKTEDLCVSGKCLYFDGTSSKVTASKSVNNVETVSFWVRPMSTATIGIMNLNDTSSRKINTNSSGVLSASGFTSPTYYINGLATTNPVILANRWNFVVITTTTGVNSGTALTIGTDGTNYTQGFIDDVKMYNFALSASQIKTDFNSRGGSFSSSNTGINVSNGPQANLSDGLAGYWKMDEASWSGTSGEVADSSGDGDNATAAGASDKASITTGKFGNGGSFDGTDDYLSLGSDVSSLKITGPLTLASWVKISSTSGNKDIISKLSTSGNFSYDLQITSAGHPVLKISATGTGFVSATDTNTSISTGKWYFIAGVYDPSHSLMTIYVNGVKDYTISTGIPSSVFNSTAQVNIGSENGGSANYFNGTLDEVRVYDRALSASDISQLYTFAPGPVAYYKLDEGNYTGASGEVIDSSGYGNSGNGYIGEGTSTGGSNAGELDDTNALMDTNTIMSGTMTITGGTGSGQSRTITGNSGGVFYISPVWTTPPDATSTYQITPALTPPQSVAGKLGKAEHVPAINEILQAPSSSSLNLSGQITLSAWINVKNCGCWTDHSIVIKGQNPTNYQFAVHEHGSDYLTFTYNDTGSGTDVCQSSGTISANTWTHVAFTYTFGSASSALFYINGIPSTCTWTSGTGAVAVSTNSSYLTLGGATSEYFDGSIDEVRIYNYTQTQKQVIQDMNAGQPAPAGPVPDPIGFWKFDEGYGTTAYNSGNCFSSCDATLNGSPLWSLDGKYGKAISLVSATSQYASAANPTQLQQTSDITLSAWVKPTDRNSTYTIIGKSGDPGSGNNIGYRFFLDTSGKLNFQSSSDGTAANAKTATGNFVIPIGTWSYVAAVYSAGNSVTFYVNGIKDTQDSTNVTASIFDSSANFLIGADNSGSAGVLADYFNGSIDEVKIYGGSFTQNQIQLDFNQGSTQIIGSFSDSTSGNPTRSAAAEYCVPGDVTSCTAPVGRWDFEIGKLGSNAGNDTSGNGNDLILSNMNSVPGKIGWGGLFNGSSSSVSMNTPSFLNASALTLEAWIYPTSMGQGNEGIIMSVDNGYIFNGWVLSFNPSSTNGLEFVDNFGSGNLQAFTVNNAVTLNKWNYVQVTWDGSTTAANVHFYVNGVPISQSGSVNAGGSRQSETGSRFAIGSSSVSTVANFSGKIDQVRVYNYVRSIPQLDWDYNRGGPVAWYKFDECQGSAVHDSSGMGNTGSLVIGGSGTQTAAGTCTDANAAHAWNNGVNGKFNSSLNFDGTDDYVSVPDNTSIDFDRTNPFSFSMWTKTSSTGNIMSKIFGSILSNPGWSLDDAAGSAPGGQVEVGLFNNYSGGNWMEAKESSKYINDGKWHHIVITYTGSSSASGLQIYIDGMASTMVIQRDTLTSSIANSGNLTIGYPGSSGNYYNGQIDDVRIFNYTLTAAQVKLLYNNGAVSFAPTTSSP